MKSWSTKLRIFFALDSDKPLPPGLRKRVNRNDGPGGIVESSDKLHRALHAARPKTDAPPFLHKSIMRAIETSRPVEDSRPAILRWLPVPAMALAGLLILGLVWFFLRPTPPKAKVGSPSPQTLTQATLVLESGENMAVTMPDALLTPLSEELQRLNRDLDRTGQLLLASLP